MGNEVMETIKDFERKVKELPEEASDIDIEKNIETGNNMIRAQEELQESVSRLENIIESLEQKQEVIKNILNDFKQSNRFKSFIASYLLHLCLSLYWVCLVAVVSSPLGNIVVLGLCFMLYSLPIYIMEKIEKVKNISLVDVIEKELLEKFIPGYASFTRDYSNVECEKQELLKLCSEAKGIIKLVEDQKPILSRYKVGFEIKQNLELAFNKLETAMKSAIIRRYNLSTDEVEGKSSDEIMDMVLHRRSQSITEEQPNLEEQSATEEDPQEEGPRLSLTNDSNTNK